jgi:hypothetical protein
MKSVSVILNEVKDLGIEGFPFSLSLFPVVIGPDPVEGITDKHKGNQGRR